MAVIQLRAGTLAHSRVRLAILSSLPRPADILKALAFSPVYLLSLVPQGRATVRSVLFVTQVLPLPIKPQRWLSPASVRESITFELSRGPGEADVYRIPDGRPRAGLLLFVGINPAPRDDHRVVNLGHALARSGFVAMFPWSPSLMGKRIDPVEPDNLVRTFEHLRDLDYVDANRVGMGGLCVGASMVMIAASDPRINRAVSFVSAFGGFYNMEDMLVQISSNRSFYRDQVDPWRPNHLTEEVLVNQLIEGLDDEGERAVLKRLFGDEGAISQEEFSRLSEEGQRVYPLLCALAAPAGDRKPSLEEAEMMVQDLPQRFHQELSGISPSSTIDDLKARLLIAHDREDDLVPAEESRRLADALSRRGDYHHTEFSFFSHVTPGKRVAPHVFVKEAFKLFLYTYRIIRVAS